MLVSDRGQVVAVGIATQVIAVGVAGQAVSALTEFPSVSRFSLT
jgi:flagellar biogenesis protein FliO